MNTNNDDLSKTVRIEAYMPITRNFDNHMANPSSLIGRLETTPNGRIAIDIRKQAKVSYEALQRGECYFAPTIQVKKIDKKGNILEAELIGISLVDRKVDPR